MSGEELQKVVAKEGDFPATLIERARQAAGLPAH
jgi:hypothetical protein